MYIEKRKRVIDMKKYSNYAEQVSDNVEELELFNEINEVDELWYEPLLGLISENTSDETIIEWYDLPKDTPTDTDEFYQLRQEAISESLDSIYQTYKVTLKGEYNEEHERLEIIWNDEAGSYIMPVFHFGTAWSYVDSMN